MTNKKYKTSEAKFKRPDLTLVEISMPAKISFWKRLKEIFGPSDFTYQDWERLEMRRPRPKSFDPRGWY